MRAAQVADLRVRPQLPALDAVAVPGSLQPIGRIVGEDYQVAALDGHLWAFRGFHAGAQDPHYRARLWNKVRLAAIGPPDVVGLGVWEMAFMANVAREIEEPILEYSHQNGEGFRFLLPSLARFLCATTRAGTTAP